MARPRSEHSDRTDHRGDPGAGVTVATHFARPLARALRRLGVAPKRVLGELAGKALPPRIPYRDAAAAWQAAADATGEPAIGVLASACLVAGDYGLIEYLARSSATLRIAAERLGRYHRLMNDRADAQLSTRGELRGGEVRLRYVGPAALAMPRPYVEYVIGAWVRLAREATDEPRVVLAVHLPFPAPRDRRPYRGALGATITFDRPHADVILDARILDRPLVGADTQVTAMLERHADAILAAQAPAAEWRRKVRDALRPRLADGTPRLATIAASLGHTERALRRRLEAEGTTFAQILDDLRQSLALQMVDDPAVSVGEIAFVLGFSEASAFHRAFRRWTGRTPRPPRRA